MIRRWSFMLALCLLAACRESAPPAAPQPAAPATQAAASSETETEAMPEFPTLSVTTFDGGTFDLQQHRGHWVVVNYWATWCNPCLKEIPDLAAMDQAHEDIEVIGLAYEEIERARMEEFLKTHPIAYPIAIVDTFEPPADFGVPKGLPMTHLIAPDGRRVATHLGPVTSEEILQDIARAKGG